MPEVAAMVWWKCVKQPCMLPFQKDNSLHQPLGCIPPMKMHIPCSTNNTFCKWQYQNAVIFMPGSAQGGQGLLGLQLRFPV